MIQISANFKRWRVACLLLAASLLAVGCGKAKQANVKPKEKETTQAGDEFPGKVTGKGWRIRWRTPDVKHPGGDSLPMLDANAETGALADEGENVTMQLRQVKARLYKDGKPAAELVAPRIKANQEDKVLVATGGVTITSLPKPSENSVTADTITWDTDTNKIVAVGNAQIVRIRKDGTRDMQSGGRITFDNNFDEFSVE